MQQRSEHALAEHLLAWQECHAKDGPGGALGDARRDQLRGAVAGEEYALRHAHSALVRVLLGDAG
eukprot:3970214-Pleurochrysis_carterae.AAC.1